MKRVLLSSLICFAISGTAVAGSADVDMTKMTTKELFGDLVEDLGAAMSYRAIAPAEPLGSLGIDIGVEATGNKIVNTEAWKQATNDEGSSTIYSGKVHVHKGLPLGIDLGAFYGSYLDSNMKSIGAEVRYAILEGSTVTPALALRGTYTLLSGVDNLDLNTAGVELSISKGFVMLTPYGGVGAIRYTGEGTGANNQKFDEESETLAKYFLGVNLNLGLINFAAEADRTGESNSYSAKLGFRF